MTQTPMPQELGPEHWKKRAREVALEKGLDPNQFSRLIGWESSFDPKAGPSSAGALGLGQFMPGTAKAYGIDPLEIGRAHV